MKISIAVNNSNNNNNNNKLRGMELSLCSPCMPSWRKEAKFYPLIPYGKSG
jgi:hypothetical protein